MKVIGADIDEKESLSAYNIVREKHFSRAKLQFKAVEGFTGEVHY